MRVAAAAVLVIAACAVEPTGDPTDEPTATSEQAVTSARCPDGPTVEGIDVSLYQGAVDWKAVKASGRVFGIARINVGNEIDPYFTRNWRGMHDAGLVRGAYQYYKPSFDPVQQASLVVAQLGVLGPDDMPAMLDLETTSGLSAETVLDHIHTWLDIVEAGTGKRPLIYAGAYFWDDNLRSSAFASYPLVIPWYGTRCPGLPDAWNGEGWRFHQYSKTGTVPGVATNPTDLDVYNGTEADLRAWIAPSACEPIGPDGRTIDDSDGCFHAGGPASYLHRETSAGYGGLLWTYATADAHESNFADWRLDIAVAGRYRIDVFTPAGFAQSRAARYRVIASGSPTYVVIDQTAINDWQSLGEFDLAAGTGQSVHLGDDTGEPEANEVRLAFDAVHLTPVARGGSGEPTPPDGSAGGCAASGDGSAAALFVIATLAARRRRRTARSDY
jgi:lysozyme